MEPTSIVKSETWVEVGRVKMWSLSSAEVGKVAREASTVSKFASTIVELGKVSTTAFTSATFSDRGSVII
jgi:hypothetical protein